MVVLSRSNPRRSTEAPTFGPKKTISDVGEGWRDFGLHLQIIKPAKII